MGDTMQLDGPSQRSAVLTKTASFNAEKKDPGAAANATTSDMNE